MQLEITADLRFARSVEQQTVADVQLRRQRQCELIWRLGARVFFELIDELDRHHCLEGLDRRLERYAALNPDLLHFLSTDRCPHPAAGERQ